MMHRPLRIIDILTHAAEVTPHEGIVSATPDGIHRYTYPDALARAAQLAHALTAHGIRQGDRIATLAWNSHRHFELYFAISGMGAVCHTINPRLSDDQLIYIFNHASDRILFLEPDFIPLIDRLRDRLPADLAFVTLTENAIQAETETVFASYEQFLADQPTAYDWPNLPEDTAAALCYTSGTTGDPKGALFTHRSTVLHTMMVPLSQTSSFRAGYRAMPVVPLFHANAWGLPYAAPLMGMTLVMPGSALDGTSLWSLMEAEQVYSAWGVPTVWAGLLAEIENRGRPPAGFLDLVVGGSAMPNSLALAYEERGIQVSRCWGMTEMSPVGARGTPGPDIATLDTATRMAAQTNAGQRCFGVDFKLVGDNGALIPHDGHGTGELHVRGNSIISGYFDNTAASAAAIDADGWFATGDIATVDSQGRLTVHDRAKDLVKSGGEWISSIDLENVATAHPGITCCAVIAMPHPKWDERPILVAVARSEPPPDLSSLHDHMAAHFAEWQLPDDVIYVDALPLTATGKVSKLTLRQQFADYVLPDLRRAQ
ncbi:long-chain-fatty-acid--CoA ligase [Roseovarius pelagicus]|uniref:Long-chain-fatty-acid--CoA ligase n=2 Tax=Roseovarius pelagicus TaxID=2980108 RepID=A0ABY6DGC4_9RHOB|nr:long-chain-fatty-acid--CoA ligase [Roseovarius pelagicus]